MIRFENDYTEGAHKRILEQLWETNEEQTSGYGTDEHCEKARAYIRTACDAPNADVHFLVGGTQTNTTVIASILRPHQGVVSAATGHIAVHETGAIEATGHKVLTVPSEDGKIQAHQVKEIYDAHWNDVTHEHMVQPGMVYISHPTENGTTYTKAELEAISKVCRENGLPLFLDGARLGYGLVSEECDLTLADVARLCDVFYIGGTKVGALFGEAVVIMNDALKKDFRYMIKQRGGMLAKGRLLGIQFETLFEDGLYFDISRHAVQLAMMIRAAFSEKGFSFRYDSTTNQQFPILPDEICKELGKKYSFSHWEKADETHSVVRFCTSWATKRENVETLIEDIRAL
ncbi:threonine aldolase family protein [Brevibacillus centrosporus]|uniref:L-threonine aldolase n=1 Tax=Brevibacillus centrosporus TaxID=54910 RepID=A0A1I3XF95_9BACL|nr:low specificity L-threonine aldolase [Brevibacillus centrosporus]MEC2133222.1 low specificity L-threonine aldolase [Brevibacillus centrosporus]MED4910975.1 low specificity L-threonine aldolase [Brevibacillus centrosporus]RNB64963.1 low specificity L-threonine aldolase [Brevibacillus centrosporus]SFK18183.1 L-threonine aldolase [Brevibacillus centrosporus]GED31171.1 amino acid lyase [Brevibacillus centrosporus]